jgi:hypothetical protein
VLRVAYWESKARGTESPGALHPSSRRGAIQRERRNGLRGSTDTSYEGVPDLPFMKPRSRSVRVSEAEARARPNAESNPEVHRWGRVGGREAQLLGDRSSRDGGPAPGDYSGTGETRTGARCGGLGSGRPSSIPAHLRQMANAVSGAAGPEAAAPTALRDHPTLTMTTWIGVSPGWHGPSLTLRSWSSFGWPPFGL